MEQERVGQQLGNYRLLRIIGSGGYATVYLGEHIILKTQAAIKVLKAIELTDKQQEQFLEEARTVSKLTHRHIIRVLDCGIPYIVMSYAPEGSTRKKYPHGTLVPFDVVTSYTKQVADALHYAHEQNVIHCDVKPENILISSPNEIVLSDFGIAGQSHTAFLGRPEFITNPTQIPGTPTYMAPERLLQGIRRRATDQYALAVVVYEWLTGEPPFTGNVERIIHMHASTPPPSLHIKNPRIPSEVEQVVMKALEKDPAQRYPEIKEFARALEEAFRYAAQPHIIAPSSPEEQSVNGQLFTLQPTTIKPAEPTSRRVTRPLSSFTPPLARPLPPAQQKTPQPRVSPPPLVPQAVASKQPLSQSLPPQPQQYGGMSMQQPLWYSQNGVRGGQTSTATPHNATTFNIQPPPLEDEGALNEFKEMFKVPRGSFDSWFDNRFAGLQEHRWFRRLDMFALFLSACIVAPILHSWYIFFLCLLALPIFYCCIRLVKTIFAGFLGIILALYWGWVAWTIAEPLNAALHWFPPTLIIATVGFLLALFAHMRYVTDRLP